VNELRLQLLQPRLGLLVLGQVAHEAGEIDAAFRLHLADREVHRKGCRVAPLAGHDPAYSDDVPLAGRAVARDIAIMT